MKFLLLTVIVFSISVAFAESFFSSSTEYADSDNVSLISRLSAGKQSFLPLLMLLYFIQTSAIFQGGCWNRKNKRRKITSDSKNIYKRHYEKEQVTDQKPKVIRVRQWADEDDFHLFVYLKLDELIQNGQAGVHAVEQDTESEVDEKKGVALNKIKPVNITHINGDNSNISTDIINDTSMNTTLAISTSSTAIRSTTETTTTIPPTINITPPSPTPKTTTPPTPKTTTPTTQPTTPPTTPTTPTTPTLSNRAACNINLSTTKPPISTPMPPTPPPSPPFSKTHNKCPTSPISILLAEITQNTDKINKKVESLILEGTRALQSDWRDVCGKDQADDDIDDIGVDLDYFTFLASIPDAIKNIENQKGTWDFVSGRFRLLRTFWNNLVI